MKYIFKNLPSLRTERLILRKISVGDAQDIFDYAKRPKVSKYTLWYPHKTINVTLDFIRFIIRNYRAGKPENWGIVNIADNKLVGTIGFFNYDLPNRKAEIHYALSDKYSGFGIMSEAVRKVLQFGFKEFRLNRIEAKCMLENAASEKVMQKCGMRYEGIARKVLFVKGKYVDLKCYAVLKSDLK